MALPARRERVLAEISRYPAKQLAQIESTLVVALSDSTCLNFDER
jgi:hypothetical protein